MRRGLFNRVNDLLVAGAAAEILENRLANLIARRARMLQQKRVRREHHAGRAIAALDRAAIHERLLQRMQRAMDAFMAPMWAIRSVTPAPPKAYNCPHLVRET